MGARAACAPCAPVRPLTRAQGKYLGTLQNVSHLDMIGWTNAARYTWAQAMGRAIPFRPVEFYLGVADYLARVVEGGEADDGAERARLEQTTGAAVDVEGASAGGAGAGAKSADRPQPKPKPSGDDSALPPPGAAGGSASGAHPGRHHSPLEDMTRTRRPRPHEEESLVDFLEP
jgi:hypothetical protein